MAESSHEIDVDELFTRPELFLYDVDLGGGLLELRPATREEYQRSIFLDRIMNASAEGYTLPIAALLGLGEALPTAAGRLRYVFHSAFCCSTLVARVFELPGTAFALKEPAVYSTLASLERRGVPDGYEWSAVLDLVEAFMGRTWEPHEVVVIKPGDHCNNLIVPLLQRDPAARALLLTSSLPEFLLSVLKSPERRAWTRNRLRTALHDAGALGVLAGVEPTSLDDGCAAAYLWLVQQYAFLHAVQGLGPTRVRTLDCDALLADPLAIVSRLAAFFGLDLPPGCLDQAVAGCFGVHAKNPMLPYDAGVRVAEQAQARDAHASELHEGIAWAESLTGTPLPWSAEAAPLGQRSRG